MYKFLTIVFLVSIFSSIYASALIPFSPENSMLSSGFFIKNIGQYDSDILYYADISSGRIYIRKNDIVFQFIEPIPKEERELIENKFKKHLLYEKETEEIISKERKIFNVYVSFPNSDFSNIQGEDEKITKINIFKGNNSDGWFTDIPTYGSVRLKDIHSGVDLVLGGEFLDHLIWRYVQTDGEQKNRNEKITPIIRSGTQINYEGHKAIINLPFGKYSLPMPEKEEGGVKENATFSEESFLLGAQQLLWGTYIGGLSDDYGKFLCVDSSGDIVFAGYTNSSDIPVPEGYDQTYNGLYDIYVAKLSSSGNSLLWGTYIGGSDNDYDRVFSLDSSGNVIIGGHTYSTDIPVPNGYDQTHNGLYDFYVAKLSSNGDSLFWGTYIGGSLREWANGISLDFSENVIIGGYTQSTNIPVPNGYDQTHNGLYDLYVAKLSSNGDSLFWGTYIGGSNNDYAYALSLDSSNNVVIGGHTFSTNIPVPNGYDQTQNGNTDIYIAKLSSSGDSLLWGTYIGGSYNDVAHALSLDSSNNVVIGGHTFSTNIPVPNGYDQIQNGNSDIYIAKLSSSGDSLLWGTYIGGANNERVLTLSLDSSEGVVVGGYTDSSDIPVYNGYDHTPNGYEDIYVAKLSSSGDSLSWATYIGGSSNDRCSALSVDSSGNVVIGGYTVSSDIQVPNGYDQTYNGSNDMYLAKLCFSPDSFQLVSPSNAATNQPINGLLLNWEESIGATSYDLYFGTTSPPSLYQSDLLTSSYTLNGLSYNTQYYWYVVAKNSCGNTNSTEWSFTTYSLPKPIPDGSGTTTAMKALKTSPDGSTLQISWDDQCLPLNANIIYGELSGISTYSLLGSKCDILNPDTWNIGSTTNIWFVIVTDEGWGTESSWGFSTTGQRNGTNPSFQCGNTLKDNSLACQ